VISLAKAVVHLFNSTDYCMHGRKRPNPATSTSPPFDVWTPSVTGRFCSLRSIRSRCPAKCRQSISPSKRLTTIRAQPTSGIIFVALSGSRSSDRSRYLIPPAHIKRAHAGNWPTGPPHQSNSLFYLHLANLTARHYFSILFVPLLVHYFDEFAFAAPPSRLTRSLY